ncbi:hypothetical protein CSKR_101640 [Clonorchis sinensis]|uniref:Uncharacterized protein n=1 Tax=Clonorchis sinensis TaxID=79923 RepID=A0A3R7H6A6_CLOSI|nr:hypothetical protein CSKR_101640 [Clonorchis sinensis]
MLMSVVRTRSLPLDSPCQGLGNLAVSQPSCFLLVAWQLGAERVLQLNDNLKKSALVFPTRKVAPSPAYPPEIIQLPR